MKLSQLKNRHDRLNFLKTKLNLNLLSIDRAFFDDESKVHCENLIGATSLPLGIAGPLKLKGDFINGNYYLPLATTEGALVASVNRGCKVITLAGGATINNHRVGVTRGPVFYTNGIIKNQNFYKWLKKNKKKLAVVAQGTSAHLKLIKTDVRTLSNYAYLRFYFNTQDAMGMNMVTIATEKMVKLIEKETGIKCLSVAGNFDIDKKPAWLNFINSRGFKVWGEIIVPKSIVTSILKTTPELIFEVWLAKCLIGSAMSGSLGFNAHYANIVTAFFAATGQDIAHTVEGSLGITTAKVLKNGDLYFSVYLPALLLGTVGGGTQLKTQTEAQEIIGVKKSEELSEVLGGAVLAGELSLLASLAEGSLANVHQKLGR